MDGQSLIFKITNLANFHDTWRERKSKKAREGGREGGREEERERERESEMFKLLTFGKIRQDGLGIEQAWVKCGMGKIYTGSTISNVMSLRNTFS